MSPSTQRPPTQNVMAMDCSASVMVLTGTAELGYVDFKKSVAQRSVCVTYNSQVFDIENFVFLDAPRCFYFRDVAGIFADQRTRNGRTDGDLVALDVCLIIPDDLISHG